MVALVHVVVQLVGSASELHRVSGAPAECKQSKATEVAINLARANIGERRRLHKYIFSSTVRQNVNECIQRSKSCCLNIFGTIVKVQNGSSKDRRQKMGGPETKHISKSYAKRAQHATKKA